MRYVERPSRLLATNRIIVPLAASGVYEDWGRRRDSSHIVSHGADSRTLEGSPSMNGRGYNLTVQLLG